MIAVLQRVKEAQVDINCKQYSAINNGILILLGINKIDTISDVKYLINKIVQLRIFNDDEDKMNLSISDINGDILVVSQFTLLANIQKGRRPSFTDSAKPDAAKKLYDLFIDQLKEYNNLNIQTGVFGSMMNIKLINNCPATFILNIHN